MYVGDAYAQLRSMGLRVSVRPPKWEPGALYTRSRASTDIVATHPAPGTPLKPGSVVTLVAEGGPIAAGVGPPPRYGRYRLPNFVGRSAAAALGWAWDRSLSYAVSLPSLHAASARSFFAAYRVVGQRPAAGSVVVSGKHPSFLEFTVTPRR